MKYYTFHVLALQQFAKSISNVSSHLAVLIFFLFQANTFQVQAQFNCGWEIISNQFSQSNTNINSFNSFKQAAIAKAAQIDQTRIRTSAANFTQQTNNYKIPVVFHLVGVDANTLTYADLQAQIALLNQGFSNNLGSPYTSSDDAQITFCLAQSADASYSWSQSNYPGVMRYNFPIHETIAQSHEMVDVSSNQNCVTYGRDQFQNLGIFNPSKYLNIFVITNIFEPGSCNPSGIIGYSSIPGLTNSYDEIYMRADQMYGFTTSVTGKALIHEVGHYLGLFHTFHSNINSCEGSLAECLSATNDCCNHHGDLCCDTPPQNLQGFSCGTINSCSEIYFSNYANGDAPDMVENLMSYGLLICGNTFTDDQVNLMHSTIALARSTLVSASNISYTGIQGCPIDPTNITAPINSYIAGTNILNNSGCIGSIFDFRTVDYSVFAGLNVSYSWNFPGGSPPSSTVYNPGPITYNSAGVHTYTVTITDINNSTSTSNTGQIIVSDCSPLPTGDNWMFGIANNLSFASGIGVMQSPNSLIGVQPSATPYSSASYTHSNGQTIYTDGKRVWTTTNGVVSFPLTLEISFVFENGLVIVPKPSTPNHYLIIGATSDLQITTPNHGLTQYEVFYDGSVAYVLPNQPTYPTTNFSMRAGITVVENEDNTGYWLICVPFADEPGSSSGVVHHDYILAYPITSTGIGNTPIWSKTGTLYDNVNYPGNWIGQGVISKDRRLYARLYHPYGPYNNSICFYNFDCKSGKLNFIGQHTPTFSGSIAFSPDANILYTYGSYDWNILLNGYNLEQIDISNIHDCSFPSLNSINVGSSVNCLTWDQNGRLQIRLGPDDRIYCVENSYVNNYFERLGIVHFPNTLVSNNNNACGYSPGAISTLPNAAIIADLPNNIQKSTLVLNAFEVKYCDCGKIKIYNKAPGINYSWDFGDGTPIVSGMNDGFPMGATFNYKFPEHVYTAPGTYTITCVVDGVTTMTNTVTITTNLVPIVTASANPGLTVCPGQSVTLNGNGAATYSWVPSNINNGIPFIPSTTTVYTVTGTTSTGCTNSSTITISVLPNSTASAFPSTICNGSNTQLAVGACSNPIISYSWQPSSAIIGSNNIQNPIGSPLTTTTYTVTLTDVNNVTFTSTVIVNVNPAPNVQIFPSSLSVCLGQSVTLTGGGNASTYSWSSGITNGIPFTPSVTNIYTVTGTNVNGCTATQTVTIVVNSLPTITANAIPSVNLCTNQSVTLSGGGASSYLWTGGVSNGVPFVISATSTYTVTGTDANGCSNTSSITINVTPYPNTSITTPPPFICIGANATLSAIGATSYNWQPGNLSGSSIIVSPTSTTTYTVTGTTNGCSSTATITVTILPSTTIQCCAPNIPANFTFINPTVNGLVTALPNNSTFSNNTWTISNINTTIAIEGTFTVNENVVFLNCSDVRFAPNAVINVTANKKISLSDGTVFKAACSIMWQGINAISSGSGVDISGNSSLYNMHHGVRIDNGGTLTVNGGNFIDNYISIQLNNTPSSYTGVIRNSIFKTVSPFLLPPFATQTRGEMAILLNNCRSLTIGGLPTQKNTFENLYNGISFHTSLSVPVTYTTSYNTFKNIHGGYSLWSPPVYSPMPFSSFPRGACIFGNNSTLNNTVTLIHEGNNNGTTTADFENSQKACLLTGFSTDILNCHSINTDAGFLHYKCEFQTQKVNHCNILNTYLGILLNGNGTAGSGINNNQITLLAKPGITTWPHSVTNPLFTYWSKGIDFNFFINNPWSGTLCLYNNISSNASDAVIGIGFQNIGLATVVGNNISFTSTASNPISNVNATLKGMKMSNSFIYAGRVRDNKFLGTFSASNPNRRSVGIELFKTKNAHLICNEFNNLRTGMFVLSNCEVNAIDNTQNAQTGFKGNKFNQLNLSTPSLEHGILFRHLGSSGSLGNIGDQQHDNKNTFGVIGAYSSGKKLFSMCGPNNNSFNSIFTAPNNLSSNEVGSSNGSCGYLPQNNNIVHLEYSCSNGQYVPKTGFTLSTAIDIAEGDLLYTEYNDVADWMDENELYRQLMEDVALRTSDVRLQNFYNTQNLDATANIEACNVMLNSLIDPITGELVNNYNSLLEDIEGTNEDIISTDQYEVNERIINGLYLKYLQEGAENFTVSEFETIETLALQCPYIGGSAVFKARNLYTLYNPLASYNDLETCNNAGVYKGGDGKGLFDDENAFLNGTIDKNIIQNGIYNNNIKVYPNPANEMVTVEYNGLADNSIFTIYDMIGRIILQTELPNSVTKITIDVSKFAKAVYTYKQSYEGRILTTGKLIID